MIKNKNNNSKKQTNKNMRQGLQNNGFETKSCACCSDHRTVLIWLRSKTFGDSRSRNCTKKQSQMLKKWSVTVQKIETLWRVISYKLMAQACQLESTSKLIDKKANLTAKYRSVCNSDIVVLLYYIGFVGLLFPCNVKQWTSFSIWFEWPDRDSDREYICLSVTFSVYIPFLQHWQGWNQFEMTALFFSVPRYGWCAPLSHPSSYMLVNHGPSQQSSKEEYKPWKWGATERYYASHTKTMLPTRRSVPRSSRQSDHTKTLPS